MSNSNLNINTYNIPANSGVTIATGLSSNLAIERIYESSVTELKYTLFFDGENRGSGILNEGFKINTSNLDNEGFTEVRLFNDTDDDTRVKIVYGSAEYLNFKTTVDNADVVSALAEVEDSVNSVNNYQSVINLNTRSIKDYTVANNSVLHLIRNTLSSIYSRLSLILNKTIDVEEVNALLLAKNTELLNYLRNPLTLINTNLYAGNATHQIILSNNTTHIKIYNSQPNKNFWLTLRANGVNGRLLSRRNISNQDSYRGDREIFLLDIQTDNLVSVSLQTTGTGTNIYFQQLHNN